MSSQSIFVHSQKKKYPTFVLRFVSVEGRSPFCLSFSWSGPSSFVLDAYVEHSPNQPVLILVYLDLSSRTNKRDTHSTPSQSDKAHAFLTLPLSFLRVQLARAVYLSPTGRLSGDYGLAPPRLAFVSPSQPVAMYGVKACFILAEDERTRKLHRSGGQEKTAFAMLDNSSTLDWGNVLVSIGCWSTE